MKRETQKSKIKQHLESGQPITPIDALERYGCFRLAAIIHTLRHEDGMNIEKELIKNKFGTKYGKYTLKETKILQNNSKQEEEKAKLLLKMKKYNTVKFGNDLNGNRYFKIGYWKPINSNDQYYVKQHSKLKFEEQSVWDDDCGYKYWYSIK